jgi:hypothetical protein
MISERGETETSPLIYLRTIDTQPRAVSLPHSAPARSTKRGQHSGRDDADNAYEYEWRTHGHTSTASTCARSTHSREQSAYLTPPLSRSTKRGQHSGRDDADNAYEYEWRLTAGRPACSARASTLQLPSGLAQRLKTANQSATCTSPNSSLPRLAGPRKPPHTKVGVRMPPSQFVPATHGRTGRCCQLSGTFCVSGLQWGGRLDAPLPPLSGWLEPPTCTGDPCVAACQQNNGVCPHTTAHATA